MKECDYTVTNYISKNGIAYKIARTIKKANKKTQILCTNNSVVWRQTYPLGRCPVVVESVICQPSSFIEKEKICILVISGKPDGILGLDEGLFLSAQFFSIATFNKIYVMSENAFSKLEI